MTPSPRYVIWRGWSPSTRREQQCDQEDRVKKSPERGDKSPFLVTGGLRITKKCITGGAKERL